MPTRAPLKQTNDSGPPPRCDINRSVSDPKIDHSTPRNKLQHHTSHAPKGQSLTPNGHRERASAPCRAHVCPCIPTFPPEVPMKQLPAQVRFTGDRRTQHTARVLRIGLQLPDVQPRHPSARGEPTYVHNRTPRGTSDCKEPTSPFQTATDHPRILARTPASTHARTHPRTHTHADMSAGRHVGRQADKQARG